MNNLTLKFYETFRYPINKTSIKINLTNNSEPGILSCNTLLALVKWCEENDNRSTVIEQDKLGRTAQNNSSTTNNNLGRNGSSTSKSLSDNGGEGQ